MLIVGCVQSVMCRSSELVFCQAAYVLVLTCYVGDVLSCECVFLQPYLLPVVQGKHQDLKSIAPETVSDCKIV